MGTKPICRGVVLVCWAGVASTALAKTEAVQILDRQQRPLLTLGPGSGLTDLWGPPASDNKG